MSNIYCSTTEINIPDTVYHIDSSVFEGCTSLETVTIPHALKKIYASSFEGCTGLKKVYIPRDVMETAKAAFEKLDAEIIEID